MMSQGASHASELQITNKGYLLAAKKTNTALRGDLNVPTQLFGTPTKYSSVQGRRSKPVQSAQKSLWKSF